ncbi:hypothetical protein C447_12430 [Halococcus hamelinensis 100A6]|uniref:Uncharacterized protein n=1 Tax=Halococcus hamelinensis 100A6 TaxID=1132509 RepID=M0M068_9EURY|nr:hypothetical protein C447_12430 [Halococcus hamelinensis 100A6]
MSLGDSTRISGVIGREYRNPRNLTELREEIVYTRCIKRVYRPNSVIATDRMACSPSIFIRMSNPANTCLEPVDRLECR